MPGTPDCWNSSRSSRSCTSGPAWRPASTNPAWPPILPSPHLRTRWRRRPRPKGSHQRLNVSLFLPLDERWFDNFLGALETQPARRQSSAPLIDHDRDDDGAADDDPFIVLIEMQRSDRLADQNDQK